MADIETVEVIYKDNPKLGLVVINADDFDPDKHDKPGEPKKRGRPARKEIDNANR